MCPGLWQRMLGNDLLKVFVAQKCTATNVFSPCIRIIARTMLDREYRSTMVRKREISRGSFLIGTFDFRFASKRVV
ncbi:hypothetical protein ANTPLA_LOCUS8793 [Anthophora plagiata]